jgi:molybdate transport system substrate-binding protein
MRNVVSEETDVKGIVAKVALGEADAGFVYGQTARPVSSRVQKVFLPAWAPAADPLPGGDREVDAAPGLKHGAFIRKLLSKRGRLLLRRAGFGLPKK